MLNAFREILCNLTGGKSVPFTGGTFIRVPIQSIGEPQWHAVNVHRDGSHVTYSFVGDMNRFDEHACFIEEIRSSGGRA